MDSALAFGGNSWLQGKAKQGKAIKKKPDQKNWVGEVLGLWLVVAVESANSEQGSREWLTASMGLIGLLLQSHIGLGF